MSLLSAHTLLTNATLRARVESAIRKHAATATGADGPVGRLARAGYTAPDTVAPAFMLRLATNGEVVAKSCPSCGDAAGVDDAVLEWIVVDAWDKVAAELFPDPADAA